MTFSRSSADRALRRIRPGEHRAKLSRRDESELLFIEQLGRAPKLLLDTTVYVDDLRGRLSPTVRGSMGASGVWHSSVTGCELSIIVGLLDPRHRDYLHTVEELLASIKQRQDYRTVNPDEDTWIEAGILAGTLARLQQYGKAEQRRVLNDALIFLSAAKAGLAVLTRNVADYDFLMQLAPQGKAIFYRV